jgi:hypothetical protein
MNTGYVAESLKLAVEILRTSSGTIQSADDDCDLGFQTETLQKHEDFCIFWIYSLVRNRCLTVFYATNNAQLAALAGVTGRGAESISRIRGYFHQACESVHPASH